MAKWPFILFLHIFLLFFLPHSSHQVTINASTQALTFVHDIRQKGWIQFFSSLGWISLCFLQPIFVLPSACPMRLGSVWKHVWKYAWVKKCVKIRVILFKNWNLFLSGYTKHRLMSSLIKRHGWHEHFRDNSLKELFHQVWARTHGCHTPNNQKPSLILFFFRHNPPNLFNILSKKIKE